MSAKREYSIKQKDYIEATADALLAGKFTPKLNIAGPISDADRKLFARVTGFNLEEFNAKMAERLAHITDKIAGTIEEKLAADDFKSSELAYLFSVMEDKRATMNGRSQVATSQVNVQINNYGDSRSKDEIIASLMGEKVVEADDVI